jgi:hypothetical protein
VYTQHIALLLGIVGLATNFYMVIKVETNLGKTLEFSEIFLMYSFYQYELILHQHVDTRT